MLYMGLGVKNCKSRKRVANIICQYAYTKAIQSAPTYRVPVSGYGEKHDAVAMSADTVTILVIIALVPKHLSLTVP